MKEPLDLTNQRFGRLVCIEPVVVNKVRSWKCKCDCGNEVIVSTSQLRARYKTNCGCRIKQTEEELLNQRFGKLVVISFEDKLDRGRVRYKCKCDCGNETIVAKRYLTRGTATSCGCDTKEKIGKAQRKPNGVALYNRLISNYKGNASRRGYSFELTDEQCIELFNQNCHYCGQKPSAIIQNSYEAITYNGIDRLDSSKGYAIDNVTACCSTCNYLKNSYSEKEFIKIIKKIYENMKL